MSSPFVATPAIAASHAEGSGGLLRSALLRNILVVMSGTGLGQTITFAFAPFLSRLYGPADFGQFGAFASIAGVLSTIATLRYADAIMLPERDEKAARVLVVSLAVAAAMAVAMTLIWISANGLFGLPQLGLAGRYLWIFPVFVLVVGVNQSLVAWGARRKAFALTASSQVVRSITANLTQAVAGLATLGGVGLISGAVAGEVLSGAALWRWLRAREAILLLPDGYSRELTQAVREFKDFALYSAPQNLLNALSQAAPVILLIHFYGPAIGGLYAFATKVLETPMNFVLNSVRQVLYQKFSEAQNNQADIFSLLAKSTSMLAAIAAGPALVGLILVPSIFALVFGQQWAIAGHYARWLILWFVPAFCNVPATLLARVLRKQRELLLLDVLLFGARVAVLILGGVYWQPEQSVMVLSGVGCAFNIVLIAYIWRTARGCRSQTTAAHDSVTLIPG